MPKQKVKDLTRCVNACAEGDQACLDACYRAFESAAGGGASQDPQEGGKVFTDSDGGKVFITFGGKVF